MPKKVVTNFMRRQWAQRVVGGEKTEKDIARDTGFVLRTVRAHVERGREELAFEEARSSAIGSALQAHYENLCGLADHLGLELDLPPRRILAQGPAFRPHQAKIPRVNVPTGSPLLGYPDADRLVVSLAQHLPRSPLWADLRDWDRLADDLLENGQALRERAREEIAKAGLDDAGGGLEALLQHVDSLARGGEGLPEAAKWTVSQGIASRGSFGVARLPPKRPSLERIQQRFEDLLQAAADWDETTARTEVYEGAIDLSETLSDELKSIVLKRVLPGHCQYCPGSGDRPRRRSRPRRR